MLFTHDSPGGFATSRNLALGLSAFFLVQMASAPVTPAQAGFGAFLVVAAACAWLALAGALEGIEVSRDHRPRVFEGERIAVSLRVRQRAGLNQSLVVVEDTFVASISVTQRRLIPLMSPRWEAHLHYRKDADRNRGLYILGPTRLWCADPLGIFSRRREIACVTSLTIYPRAVPLPGYLFLAPRPPAGPTMETAARLGPGEEIIGVRPWRPGDPLSRIHWRTTARRGELYAIELDTHVQAQVVVYLDLTRRSRYGVGQESTPEMAVGCAVSLLTEAAAARHRIGLVWVKEKVEVFPPQTGLANLHLMLDRLAVVQPGGERRFWEEIAPLAATLAPGSRAVLIAPAGATPVDAACRLARGLTMRGVAVDVLLIDESEFVRIWRDQEPTLAEAGEEFHRLVRALESSGARVTPLRRGEGAAELRARSI